MPCRQWLHVEAQANPFGSDVLDQGTTDGVAKALGRIPSGLFIMTAAHEDRRMGMLTSWVQQVGFQPPMVSVAIGKGRPILPLISESRQFALCQLPEGDRLLMRKFAGSIDPGEDPFLGFDLVKEQKSVAPILAACLSYVECDVTCHMDVEADHDLFIGTVIGGGMGNVGADPHVHLRENGLRY